MSSPVSTTSHSSVRSRWGGGLEHPLLHPHLLIFLSNKATEYDSDLHRAARIGRAAKSAIQVP